MQTCHVWAVCVVVFGVAGISTACQGPPCAGHLTAFDHLLADTSDVIAPGAKAAAQFTLSGNPNLGLASVQIRAWSSQATQLTLTLYNATNAQDLPDADTQVLTTSTTLAPLANGPTDPNTFPIVDFALAAADANTLLQPATIYWAVVSPQTQDVQLGVLTNGDYDGAYQVYASGGWQPSAVSTERMALGLVSPSCK